MDDRRKETRKTTDDYFLLYEVGPNTLVGRIIDLTLEGAMVISDTELVCNLTIPCRLALPRMIELTRDIFFEATIIWSQQNDKFDWYESGLKIENIRSEQVEILQQVLQQWKEKTAQDSGYIS